MIRNMKDFEMYKKTKKEVKKIVSDTKFKTYNDLYNKFETRDGEKDILRQKK